MTSKAIATLASLAFLAGNFAAHGDVLFETYDPTNPSNTFPTNVTALSFAATQNVNGVEFTPTKSGTLTSLVANVNVQNQPPAPVGTSALYSFNLFQVPSPSTNVDPFSDTPIDTFSETVSNPTDALANFTFASTLHPFLVAGDSYWLYQGPGPGGAQPLGWGILSGAQTGTLDNAISTFGGPATHMTTTGAALPAFQLNGATVPEPGFGALIAGGLILLFARKAGWIPKVR